VGSLAFGADEAAERFKRPNDDYSAIMVKALADRLAEAGRSRRVRSVALWMKIQMSTMLSLPERIV
jgi:cobalamin-dependent methionine synthase I